ncbi:MAG TPA: hypothetical protein VHC22_17960 [Pirellulales bacterium]|nr:hypothetical protein [Pirellulales bacterium]
MSANAEHKSAAKAKRMLWKLAEIKVSVPHMMDLTAMIGKELHDHLQQQADAHVDQRLKPQYPEAPKVVSVSVDGGRLMTRADAGRGVHEQAWKETKNACLLTMSSSVSQEDPHPQLPACFADRDYVEKLVREIHSSTTKSVAKCGEDSPSSEEIGTELAPVPNCSPTAEASLSHARKAKDWRPRRLVRTCLSSMACSDDFGPLVAGEAQRRRFYQAERRAFLGDGQAWNWTLQERFFPTFVGITDFVHPLGYLYDAARVLSPADPWPVYLQVSEACWQGRLDDFLTELRAWQTANPVPGNEELPEQDPRAIIQTTITYLENNRKRMNYPEYRRAGLPVSSAMIESLIKEINYRVKGTEKFWNRPDGAEHILQVRAAALGDDDRLSQWIVNRPGSPFYRRSTPKDDPIGCAA